MNPWEDVFGEVPASFEKKIQETLAGLEDDTVIVNNKRRPRKAYVTALVAAIIAVLLAGTALAIALHTEFFHSAYGTGIAGRDSRTIIETDESGNVIKVEGYPAIERVEVDPETAEALIGDYVASAKGQSIELCGYTFTLRDYVIDENGIGAITVDVDNPNGLNIKENGHYYTYEGEFQPFTMWVWAGGWPLDTNDLRDTESTTDTHARYVIYIAGGAQSADELSVRFTAWNGTFMELDTHEETYGQVFPNYDEAELVIPTSDPVSVKSFAGADMTAELSPVGLMLQWGDGYYAAGEQFDYRSLVIEYADGSEYVVKSESVYNQTVALGMGTTVWTAFNRLVEPENVTAIHVTGIHYSLVQGGIGNIPQPEMVEETLTPVVQ